MVVTFPGSNCDQDTVHVLENVFGRSVSSVWHRERVLPKGTDLVILPGGFSYGDALRSGALARFSPIMASVRSFAEGGGFVMGICNGFQILLEAGLLPGAMLQNDRRTFVCRLQRLRVESSETPYTQSWPTGVELMLPIAHHEGRYFAPHEELDRLESEGRIAFRYVGNPNGSSRDIAGLVSENRRVLGLMPHPERACETLLGSSDGLDLFSSLFNSIERTGSL
ncbi:MAG: phosphoribosylformylglycinamidine synthase subunit PurQ [Myxococcota bacterium]